MPIKETFTKPTAMPAKAVRVPAALRTLLGWLLLAALLAAAVSYSQGTRYAMVAQDQAASIVSVMDGHDAGQGNQNASCPEDSQHHHACCDRYPAARSEPAPSKAAAPDPPAAALPPGPQHVLAVVQEPEPRRQALTLDQLSISRT
jgi:hypothetical protein